MTKVLKKQAFITDLPALTCIEKVASQIIEIIPEHMQEVARKINIIVENYADQETLDSLRIADKYELLGLYRGTPIPIKNVFQPSDLADSIFLYRCPLIRYSHENQQEVALLVKKVLLHELGHHFGCGKINV